MLQWNIGGSWEHRAFWGWDLIAWGTPGNVAPPRRRAAGRRAAGCGCRSRRGESASPPAQPIAGMAFTLFDGCAAFGAAGAVRITSGTDATGATIDTVAERVWFAGTLPAGALARGQLAAARAARPPRADAEQSPSAACRRCTTCSPTRCCRCCRRRSGPSSTVRGLGPFVDYLRARIDRADDLTDYGFVKMQTDIYRVRQLMLGSTDATRLAVSPALAAIAKAETAVASQAQIASYVARPQARRSSAAPRNGRINAGGFASGESSGRAHGVAAPRRHVGAAANLRPATRARSNARSASACADAVIGTRTRSRCAPRPSPRSNDRAAKAPTAVQRDRRCRPASSRSTRRTSSAPVVTSVVLSSPVVGKSSIRTTAIAERLARSEVAGGAQLRARDAPRGDAQAAAAGGRGLHRGGRRHDAGPVRRLRRLRPDGTTPSSPT